MKSSPSLLAALALCTSFAAACTPTVNVATERPIEININVNHEVRIKLDDNVKTAIAGERMAARGVAPRGVEDDLAEIWEDAGEVARVKGSGAVGERADGYLGIVTPPNPDAQKLIDRVDAARRVFYDRVAKQNAAPLGEVEKLAGANRLLDAAVGDWIQPPNVGWMIKQDDTVVKIEG